MGLHMITEEEAREMDAADEDCRDHWRANERIDEARMSEIEARNRFAKTRLNAEALATCPGPHDFAPFKDPEKPWGGRWKCRECGGEVDSIARLHYDQGVKHGLQKGRTRPTH
jgi:hypothetical protein